MLVLSRRVGESVVIDDHIFFTVLGIKGNQVSLGFDAPQSIVIHRHEIYEKIKAEKELEFTPA
jgi:carbon storage regulator